MNRWLAAAVMALALLLAACGGGQSGEDYANSPTNPDACSPGRQRLFIDAWMADRYYWYSKMPAADTSARTVDAYFQSKLYRPLDRYSFTQTAASFNQLFVEGRRTGYGYTLTWDDAAHSRLRVRNVEPKSPVAKAGLARGDTIIEIDGYTPDEVAQGALPAVDTVGVPRRFFVRDAAGLYKTLSVASDDFALAPVAAKTTFDVVRNGQPVKVAYIALHQFVNYTYAELNTAFSQFNLQGATELVLDLRYNGGGTVASSRDLASMIGGARTANKLFAYLRFNDRNALLTQSVVFNGPDVPFANPIPRGLQRVVIIGSEATASASELLINGLRPFVSVALIGATTYGKPYGFVPQEHCGLIYNAVNFESLNALGDGNFTSGFAPTCTVPDDLEHELGDASERRTRAALDYIATGTCPAGTALAAPKRLAPPLLPIGEAPPPQMVVQ